MTSTPSQSEKRREGFTLTELMVSVAILVIAMLAVSYIFSSVSKTTGLTTADIELNDTLAVMQQTMQADLDALLPGLLIIDSPDPNLVGPSEPVEIPDVQGDDALYVNRRDRLVFLTATSPGTYRSAFAPAITSSQAAILYGHAGYYDKDVGVTIPAKLPPFGYDRVLFRRVVLMGVQGGAPVFPVPLTLPPENSVVATRIHLSGDDLIEETASEFLTRLRGSIFDSIAAANVLYLRSLAGTTLYDVEDGVLNGAGMDTAEPWKNAWLLRYRHCFEFMPRVGHFIVEWTDGTVAPGGGQQWFGFPRDVNGDGSLDAGLDVITKAAALGESYLPEADVPIAPDYAGYRAVWRLDKDTWGFRPRAIRITVRLYDAKKRVRDGDDRLGREREFILRVP